MLKMLSYYWVTPCGTFGSNSSKNSLCSLDEILQHRPFHCYTDWQRQINDDSRLVDLQMNMPFVVSRDCSDFGDCHYSHYHYNVVE